jgi:hypothetical protein
MDDGGSAIVNYRVKRYKGSDDSGTFVESWGINRSRHVTGLTAGNTYTFTVQAINNSSDNGGFGANSQPHTVVMPSGSAPGAPGTPTFSNILPTSVTISWSAPSDDGLWDITNYRLLRWQGTDDNGPYVESYGNSLTRNQTGLVPGASYLYEAQAINGDTSDNGGFGDRSSSNIFTVPPGAWIRDAQFWKIGLPYVRVDGVWKAATPYIRSGGIWQITHTDPLER